MAKIHKNTKEHHVETIRYVISKGPEARFRFTGTIFAFVQWIMAKWNYKHPDDRITKKDVGLTPEVEAKLRESHFLPKQTSLRLY